MDFRYGGGCSDLHRVPAFHRQALGKQVSFISHQASAQHGHPGEQLMKGDLDLHSGMGDVSKRPSERDKEGVLPAAATGQAKGVLDSGVEKAYLGLFSCSKVFPS
jgi:hypothetical protein